MNAFKFNLVLCLEVDEHIKNDCSEILVSSIANLSDNVIFPKAIPSQLGVGYINEQWPDFWTSLLSGKEFSWIDFIQP